jgi:hypothetical protein
MFRKQKLALVGAVVLAGAAAGGALAGGGGRHQVPPFAGVRGGVLQAASGYLGVPVSTLLADVRSGKSLADVAAATSGKSEDGLVAVLVASVESQLDKAVSAGKLSSAEESKLEANLSQRLTTLVEAKKPAAPAMRPRGFAFGFGLGGVAQAASGYLGVPVSTLLADVRSGKSLADVAAATSGKSEDGLVAVLVASVESQLDKAVSAGKLSSAQEGKLETNLPQRLKMLVEAKLPRGFGFGRHHGSGPPSSGGASA